jgi:sugar phosphate isomerase/epimerase
MYMLVQLEDDAFDEVFKALQEAGFDGIEGHASRVGHMPCI